MKATLRIALCGTGASKRGSIGETLCGCCGRGEGLHLAPRLCSHMDALCVMGAWKEAEMDRGDVGNLCARRCFAGGAMFIA